MTKLTAGVLAALISMTCFAASLAAGEAIRINVDSDRIAIKGYDPVAYFTIGKPTKGDPRFEASWQEARWLFATAEHRNMFIADPDRYAPRYGGHCTVGLARGYLTTVDPEAWRIVDGKLYLTLTRKAQDIFAEDIPGTIEKAERNWQSFGRR
jgi:hypothetical protein